MSTPLHEKHPPSRDLDEAVAKALGLPHGNCYHDAARPAERPVEAYPWGTPIRRTVCPACNRRVKWYGENGVWVSRHYRLTRRYSADPAAAVAAMEAMAGRGWDVSMETSHLSDTDPTLTWEAEWFGPDGRRVWVYALRLPHAVALASLLALGAIEMEP